MKRTRFSAIDTRDEVSYSYPLTWFKEVAREEDINKYDKEKR